MLTALQAPKGALVVLDRGIATEENLSWMQQAGYRYLVVNRGREREFVAEDCITINTASDEKVDLKKVHCEEGKEVRLYCYSESDTGWAT